MDEQSATELLIVKDGDTYIRFIGDGFEYCSMNKASVFPVENVEEVQKKCSMIASQTGPLQLMKLIIREEPFVE